MTCFIKSNGNNFTFCWNNILYLEKWRIRCKNISLQTICQKCEYVNLNTLTSEQIIIPLPYTSCCLLLRLTILHGQTDGQTSNLIICHLLYIPCLSDALRFVSYHDVQCLHLVILTPIYLQALSFYLEVAPS